MAENNNPRNTPKPIPGQGAKKNPDIESEFKDPGIERNSVEPREREIEANDRKIEQRRRLLELEDAEETLKEEAELNGLLILKIKEQLEDLDGTDQIYLFNMIGHDLEIARAKAEYFVQRIERAHQKTEAYREDAQLKRTFPIYSDELTQTFEELQQGVLGFRDRAES